MKINGEESVVECHDSIIPLRDPRELDSEHFKDIEDSLFVQIEDKLVGDNWLDTFVTQFLDAKYEKANILDVVNDQKHSNKLR